MVSLVSFSRVTCRSSTWWPFLPQDSPLQVDYDDLAWHVALYQVSSSLKINDIHYMSFQSFPLILQSSEWLELIGHDFSKGSNHLGFQWSPKPFCTWDFVLTLVSCVKHIYIYINKKHWFPVVGRFLVLTSCFPSFATAVRRVPLERPCRKLMLMDSSRRGFLRRAAGVHRRWRRV